MKYGSEKNTLSFSVGVIAAFLINRGRKNPVFDLVTATADWIIDVVYLENIALIVGVYAVGVALHKINSCIISNVT